MSSRPAWSDAALGSRVADRNVTISVPREIAAALNAEGIPTFRGGTTWRPSALQSIIVPQRRTTRKKTIDLPQASSLDSICPSSYRVLSNVAPCCEANSSACRNVSMCNAPSFGSTPMKVISTKQVTPVTLDLELLNSGVLMLEDLLTTTSVPVSSEVSYVYPVGVDSSLLMMEPTSGDGPPWGDFKTQVSLFTAVPRRSGNGLNLIRHIRRPRTGASNRRRPRSHASRRSACRRSTRGASSGGDPPGGGSDPDPSGLEQQRGPRNHRHRPDLDPPEAVA